MVHRIKLNINRLLGPNNQIVSATTTPWVSGVTLTNQWTNSNVYPTQGNPTNYPQPLIETNVTNTVEFDQTLYNKSITIPLELKFEPMDYSDDINNWVGSETQKAINSILDGEKVKYISTEFTGVTLEFRFLDKTNTGTYSSQYNSNGFNTPTEFNTNRFNKSYFRLYFYDSNTGETANLLFTEDYPVKQKSNATFVLKRLYWNREDVLMENTYDDRTIYMEARFFNAKNGEVQVFYNLPSIRTTPIGVGEYGNPINRGWRTSPIKLINPNNSNGEHRFSTVNGVGGTTTNTITMSEFILI